MKTFASDNCAGVHPELLKVIASANHGHTAAYGDDPYSEVAIALFKKHFGDHAEVYFVFNGTGANVLCLKAAARSFNSIVCAETAHINLDETGAPENFTGCKLVTSPTNNGKITIEQIASHLNFTGNQHHSQPKVISISQATELGTVYTPEEIRALADYAHQNNMYLHMDGARLSNAAAALGVSLGAITADAGVDILSYGGTKNGMMFGEAVIIFDPELAENFKYIRKHGLQLASKMRFIAAQFEAMLSNDLWLKNARHTNGLARLLAREAGKIPGVRITQEVQSNAVFASMPKEAIPRLQEKFFFHVWKAETSEVRWMTAFDTTEADVMEFVQALKEIVG